MLIIAMALLSSGQIAKFEERKPDVVFTSKAKLEDVERCLIRFGAPPQVYRQPDRPDDVSLVWLAGGFAAGNAAARVDLHRSNTGATEIKSWLPAKIIAGCAPS